MPKIDVYDPPMCCTTGVCGPEIDPVLARFAADLEWLRGQGVPVERFNLAQSPESFAKNEVVRGALNESGEVLPLLLVDGRIVSRGIRPTRQELAAFVGIACEGPASLFTPAVAELVAIGAAIASNCLPCFRYHHKKAKELGVSDQDMAQAVATARAVKQVPTQTVIELADRHLNTHFAQVDSATQPCCGSSVPANPHSGCC